MPTSHSEPTRELAAILFADIVDFTALMHRDEPQALHLREKFKSVVDTTLAAFNGHHISYFGDGMLSLFDNAADAVNCAVNVQQQLQEDPKVPVRIGIHAGDVVISSNEVLGDSVKIASRIESFAVSGGVFVSDSVFDLTQNQPDLRYLSMGRFHLKNVRRPFEIFAIDSAKLVVPNTGFLIGKGDKIAKFSTTIPIPEHEILGRDSDIERILELIESHAIVTLTGAGGMGKTRLSLEICRRLRNIYGDGMAFVSLSTISEVNEVMPTLATVLDVHEIPGRSAVRGVIDMIGDSRAFIVLDNLEQVISAAKEIAELTAHCPNLKLLCTSRTALKIARETEVSLQPLPVPPEDALPELLVAYPAVQLFLERTRQVLPDFSLTSENAGYVATICRRLDGLPLALELAAARMRILRPDQLNERLGQALDILSTRAQDVPERHQTLRATIEWSYNLLNEEEKRLFRQLAVFSGGFTLAALEEICYQGAEDRLNTLDDLESLIDKGLVLPSDDSQRFRMLQTIRDYAMAQLILHEEVEETKNQHARWYSRFASYLEAGTMGVEQVKRLREGELEEPNLNSALDHYLEQAKSGDEEAREAGLMICGDIWMYHHIKGKNISAHDTINAFLEAGADRSPSLGKCRALMSCAVASWITGKFQKSLEYSELQHEMAISLDNEMEIIKALIDLCIAHLMSDIEQSLAYSEESIQRAMHFENDYWITTAYYFNGIAYTVKGDIDTAMERHQIALDYSLRTGDFESRGGALSGLAGTHALKGNTEEALRRYEASMESFATSGDRAEVARILSEMSWLLIRNGQTERARALTLESIQVYQEVGSTRGVGISMLGLAAIEALEDRPFSAVQIAAAADRYAEQEGIVNDYGYSSQDRSSIDKARKYLEPQDLNMAESTGHQMPLREVIKLVEQEVVVAVN